MAAGLVISIVSWNTRELLKRCLESLREHVPLQDANIVVVDNNSKDGTPDMVRRDFPQVTLLESGRNLGFGRAHNLIAQLGNEPYVLFLNPDTEIETDALSRMCAKLAADVSIGAVGCRLVDTDGTTNTLELQWTPTPIREVFRQLFVSKLTLPIVRRLFPYQNPHQDGYVRLLSGGCLMVRRDVLNSVGWFDEQFFMYSEDAELCRRIEKAGWRLFYMGSLHVIHTGAGASAKAANHFSTLMMCESVAKYFAKYYGRKGRRIYVLGVTIRAATRLCLCAAASPILLSGEGQVASKIRKAMAKNYALLMWSAGRLSPQVSE